MPRAVDRDMVIRSAVYMRLLGHDWPTISKTLGYATPTLTYQYRSKTGQAIRQEIHNSLAEKIFSTLAQHGRRQQDYEALIREAIGDTCTLPAQMPDSHPKRHPARGGNRQKQRQSSGQ